MKLVAGECNYAKFGIAQHLQAWDCSHCLPHLYKVIFKSFVDTFFFSVSGMVRDYRHHLLYLLYPISISLCHQGTGHMN